jgi:hypothetical protein
MQRQKNQPDRHGVITSGEPTPTEESQQTQESPEQDLGDDISLSLSLSGSDD